MITIMQQPVSLYLVAVALVCYCYCSLATGEFSDSESALSEAPAKSHRVKELRDDYEIIDEYLENVLADDEDLERNIEAATRLHEQWPRKKVLRKTKDYWPPEKAVELFMSLPKALESCDYASYLILVENYLAAFGTGNGLEQETKIQRIIKRCAQDHADKCGSTYMARFRQEYNQLNTRRIGQKLDIVLSADVLKLVHPDGLSQMSSVDLAMRRIKLTPEVSNIIFQNIMHTQSAEKSQTYREEEFLLAPCRQFIELLKDIFVPMSFDLGMDLVQYNEINSSRDELFENAWIKNKICMTLLNSSE